MIKKAKKIVNVVKRLARYFANLDMHEYKSNIIMIEQLKMLIRNSPKYSDPRRFEHFNARVYSQNGEDGIILSIFERIGIKDHTFVEFGTENGTSNNTLYLLTKHGWSGLWIEADKESVKNINLILKDYIDNGKLMIINEFIDKDNINSLIQRKFGGTDKKDSITEIDLLSIDIDGNDYYVWDAINIITPRVVVIEYNAKFPPPHKWSIEYNPTHRYKGDDYMGASLAALNELGNKKGYELVACDLAGVNAFFVRKDLMNDKFFRSDNINDFYHPCRYWLDFDRGHNQSLRSGTSWE